jgi:hypothetical protein
MNLPNAESAIVPDEKISAYLLDASHPQNKGKAHFYERIGFSSLRVEDLKEALTTLAQTGRVTQVEPTPRGIKYVVVGTIPAPNGNVYSVQSIWIIETNPVVTGQRVPRLVTAYPSKK